MPSLRVDADKATIQQRLGRRYFEPNWEFSEYYAGEVLNLRRVEYTDHDEFTWWQVHVRGFETSQGFELDPHWEPEPTEHPHAHVTGTNIDVGRGIETLKQILDEENIEYERIEDDDSSDG